MSNHPESNKSQTSNEVNSTQKLAISNIASYLSGLKLPNNNDSKIDLASSMLTDYNNAIGQDPISKAESIREAALSLIKIIDAIDPNDPINFTEFKNLIENPLTIAGITGLTLIKERSGKVVWTTFSQKLSTLISKLDDDIKNALLESVLIQPNYLQGIASPEVTDEKRPKKTASVFCHSLPVNQIGSVKNIIQHSESPLIIAAIERNFGIKDSVDSIGYGDAIELFDVLRDYGINMIDPKFINTVLNKNIVVDKESSRISLSVGDVLAVRYFLKMVGSSKQQAWTIEGSDSMSGRGYNLDDSIQVNYGDQRTLEFYKSKASMNPRSSNSKLKIDPSIFAQVTDFFPINSSIGEFYDKIQLYNILTCNNNDPIDKQIREVLRKYLGYDPKLEAYLDEVAKNEPPMEFGNLQNQISSLEFEGSTEF